MPSRHRCGTFNFITIHSVAPTCMSFASNPTQQHVACMRVEQRLQTALIRFKGHCANVHAPPHPLHQEHAARTSARHSPPTCMAVHHRQQRRKWRHDLALRKRLQHLQRVDRKHRHGRPWQPCMQHGGQPSENAVPHEQCSKGQSEQGVWWEGGRGGGRGPGLGVSISVPSAHAE